MGRGEQIPFSDESFDIVIADNVLEHLENPAEVFGEVARVLKPSGHFLAKTPNLWHYMPTIARLTPHSFHQFFNRLRGREGEDTFPTRYRANTRAALERWAASAGFRLERARVIEGRPEYLRLNPITYAMGWAYERAVNGIPGLERFRVLLIADMVKLPTAASRQ